MKTVRFLSAFSTAALFALTLLSCRKENAGPYQEGTQAFDLTDFDELEMGSAFQIRVQQGSTFTVVAQGDRRNLDDLDVRVVNGRLKAKYRNQRNRRYETVFILTMPTLKAADFSGASRSTVSGFTGQDLLSLTLSGASSSEVSAQAGRVEVTLSGASEMRIGGKTSTLVADLSGASRLNAFNTPAEEVMVDASGASHAEVSASNRLKVVASGASSVRYRGNSVVLDVNASGASSVKKD